jgi:hypothetical protein
MLEFGAQYIHGQNDNPIYELATKYELIEEKFASLPNNQDDFNAIIIHFPSKLNNYYGSIFCSHKGDKLTNDFSKKSFQYIK